MTAAWSSSPDSLTQRKEPPRCRKECPEMVGKLQKKNHELQRHLEKACRQLQHCVQEHKSALQKLKGIYWSCYRCLSLCTSADGDPGCYR